MRELLKAFTEKSAWTLIVPAVLLLAIADWRLLLTLLQWSAFAIALAGVSIVISMIVFPQIKLSELIDSAKYDSHLPAAIIVAALVLFYGMLFYSMVFWAKA